jgi:hypothetical protein
MIGSVLASSAQLKRVEMRDSGYFWVKLGYFLTFWQFTTKLGDSECDLRPVVMQVGAGEP